MENTIKIPFYIKDINDSLFDKVKDFFNGEDVTITTGLAGSKLITKSCIINDDFDPVLANDMINPKDNKGYRLSSYMFILKSTTTDKVAKFIPHNSLLEIYNSTKDNSKKNVNRYETIWLDEEIKN